MQQSISRGEKIGNATAPASGESSREWDLPPTEVIFGIGAAMELVRAIINVAINVNAPLLLQGPSGTGKEILARFVHLRSLCGNGAFVKLHCPGIPESLFESELFGFERGAFTGAISLKRGRVELAHRGTLFLDEISELESPLQAKLLQLLQDGHYCRLGASVERRIETRVICASNREIEREIETGTFRQDLFYRINVLRIDLPTLKERKDDIPILADYLLKKWGTVFDRPVNSISPRLLTLLQEYSWPGNIRELENIIRRYVLIGSEGPIARMLEQMIADRVASNGGPLDYSDPTIRLEDGIDLKKVTKQATMQIEKKIILQMLGIQAWNRNATARALRISRRSLSYKMTATGLPLKGNGRKPKKEVEPPSAPLREDFGSLLVNR